MCNSVLHWTTWHSGVIMHVACQESVDEMIFEGDSQGVGHLNYAQFAEHVREFVANCLDADKKAADIVATVAQGNSSVRISQRQLKEQARCTFSIITHPSSIITFSVAVIPTFGVGWQDAETCRQG